MPPTSTQSASESTRFVARYCARGKQRHTPEVHRSPLSILCLSALLVGLTPTLTAGEPSDPGWSQWRGPTRDGLLHATPWPTRLTKESLSAAWKVRLGPSYSGPIVSAKTVFTTETQDKKVECVRAFDRTTGKELWKQTWEGAISVPFFAKSNGDWIRSTPSLDGDRLYVAGMRDVLVCLKAADGQILWRYDFPAELKTALPDFGFVCSPLVTSNAVYVQAGAALAKLDKITGALIWRSLSDKGGMWGSAFSSPVMGVLQGRAQLVVQTREELAGVDPDDGHVLWRQPVEAFRGMNILTPALHENTIFTSTYGGKTLLYDVAGSGTNWSTQMRWTLKMQGYMSTPVILNGVAYHHTKSQRFMAIDLTSGKELWTAEESFGKYVSLVANADRILALDQRGTLYLLGANPKQFELIDKLKISEEETWAHLAVAGAQLFVRELNHLTAYDWKSANP